MKRAKVTIPLMGINPSGGVRMIIAVANGLAEAGFAVEIVVPDYADALPRSLHDAIQTSVIPSGSVLRKVRYPLKLMGRLSRDDALLIATGYQTPVLIHAAGLLGRRKPNVFSIIQSYEPLSHIRYGCQPTLAKPLLRWVAKLGFRLPAYKIAVSRYVAEQIGHSRVRRIVPPGIHHRYFARGEQGADPVDPSTSQSDDDERFTVGFFPTPGKVKGTTFAVEALSTLHREGVAVDFLVFDRDYSAERLPAFFKRYSHHAREHALELSARQFYHCCDVFVFPSLLEGFGLPPLEAMACGTAVVLANSGGVLEYAKDRVNCLLVPPGDAEAICRAVGQLLDDGNLRESLVAQGLQTAGDFTEERFVEQCVHIVRSLV